MRFPSLVAESTAAAIRTGGILVAICLSAIAQAEGSFPPQGARPTASNENALQSEVRQAIGKHPAVLSAAAQLNSAGFKLSADEWARYPSIRASASRERNGDKLQVVELQQPLWAGGRIDGTITGSRSRVSAAEYRLQETRLDIADQVVLGAVDVARNDALIKASQANLAALETLLSAIDRRTEGGLGLQSDVTLARSRIELATAALTQLQSAREQALARWRNLTGKGTFDLQLDNVFADAPTDSPDLVLAALNSSPTLGRLRAEADAASGDADVARSRAWPQLSLRYTRTKQEGAINQTDDQTLAVLEYQPDAGLGVADNARAADAVRDSVLHQITQFERDLEQQVLALVADLHGLLAQRSAIERNIAANKEVIDSFVRQYNIGKRTWLDVLNAQREIAESLAQREEIHHRWLASSYRLRLLTNRFFDQ